MSILSYPLTLDTSRKNAFKTVLAQQYDTHSRELVITLSNDNVQFIADSTMTAVLNGTYEDETPILPLACTINEDGTVTAPITSMALTQTSGLYSLTVTIYSSDSERLGVFPFTLEVEAGSTVPLDSFDDDSVELLTQLIGEASGAIGGAELAAQNANAAAERAEQAAEQLDVDLAEIRADIQQNTNDIAQNTSDISQNTRDISNIRDEISNLDASSIPFPDSPDPEIETVSDELLKLEDDTSDLSSRMTTAEGNITSLDTHMDTAEDHISSLQYFMNNQAEYKSNKITAIPTTPTDVQYPSAKAVKDYVDSQVQAADDAYEITYGATNVGNALDSLEEDIEDVGDDVDGIDGRLRTAEGNISSLTNTTSDLVQNAQYKTYKVTSLSAQSTDAEYPSAKCVYDNLATKESVSNKVTAISNNPTDTNYPSERAVSVYVDGFTNASSISYTSTDPNVDTVQDECEKLEGQDTALGNRLTTAEGNITSLGTRMGTAEGHISSLQSTTTSLSNNKEDKSNKVTSISSSSTDTQYPSAKCVYDEMQTKVSVMNVKFTATLDTQTMTPVISCDKSRDDILSAMQNGDLLRFTLDGSQVGMYENYTTCNYCFDATDGTLFVNILVGNINWAVKMDSAGNMFIQSYVFQV